jgi:fructokinase
MGEILIDFLPIEEEGRTIGFRMHAGGSPFNVAVGLARLGQPTAFGGKVAIDFFGRFLRSYVAAEGIDTRFLLNAPALSTLAFVAMESGEPTYAFYDEGAADTLLTVEELPDALFAETAILHYGSISLLRGTTPAAILAAAERLKGRALLSFDPNLRPGLVRDETAYRALLARLFALSDIIKVSSVDLAWLLPGRSAEQAAAELLSHGAAVVVVTQGGAGALALRAANDGIAALQVPSFAIQVVDTVGAGDTFDAGLLAGLAERDVTSRAALRGLSDEDMLAVMRFAAAAAAVNCMRAGANPPRHVEVEQFLAQH